MRIIRVKNYEELSRAAANIISAQVILKPDCVLGLATGSSPVGTYQQLIKWYQKGDSSASGGSRRALSAGSASSTVSHLFTMANPPVRSRQPARQR